MNELTNKQPMSREILDSSPAAKELAEGNHLFKPKYDFPYALLTVGKSFAVGFNEVSSFQVLRVTSDRYGKKLGKRFKVIKHEDAYEVACISELPKPTVPDGAMPPPGWDAEDNLPKWTPPKHD